MVCKLIHQIWVGPNPIPEKSLLFIQKIKDLHPDYEYKIWTDNDLNADNFSNIEFINSTPIYAQKADIMRYEILYKYGGIYLDIDFEIFKSLEPLLIGSTFVVCNEDEQIYNYMTNAFIYSEPNNNNLKTCIENIKTCSLGGMVNVAISTGPWYFRQNISLENAKVLPTHYMYPTHYTQKGFIPEYFSEETYGMHHWDKNW
jgi:mannosyltransferase OCH1-like enzyme